MLELGEACMISSQEELRRTEVFYKAELTLSTETTLNQTGYKSKSTKRQVSSAFLKLNLEPEWESGREGNAGEDSVVRQGFVYSMKGSGQ